MRITHSEGGVASLSPSEGSGIFFVRILKFFSLRIYLVHTHTHILAHKKQLVFVTAELHFRDDCALSAALYFSSCITFSCSVALSDFSSLLVRDLVSQL